MKCTGVGDGQCSAMVLLPSTNQRSYTDDYVSMLQGSLSYKKYRAYQKYHNQLLGLRSLALALLCVCSLYVYLFSRVDSKDFGIVVSSDAPFAVLVEWSLALFLLPVSLLLSFIRVGGLTDGKDTLEKYIFISLLNWSTCWVQNRKSNKMFSVDHPAMSVICDSLALQGYLLGSLIIFSWRTAHWSRARRIPFPMVTVPTFVGLCGVSFWMLFVIVLQLSAERNISFAVLSSAIQRTELYVPSNALLKCAFLSSVYYAASLLFCPIRAVVRQLMRLLPVHPTTWGLSMLLLILLLCQQLNYSILQLFLLSLVFALFYNGFVA